MSAALPSIGSPLIRAKQICLTYYTPHPAWQEIFFKDDFFKHQVEPFRRRFPITVM